MSVTPKQPPGPWEWGDQGWSLSGKEGGRGAYEMPRSVPQGEGMRSPRRVPALVGAQSSCGSEADKITARKGV